MTTSDKIEVIRMMRMWLILMFLAVNLAALPAAAVEKAIATRWHDQLVTTTRMLEGGAYKDALQPLKSLIHDILSKIEGGDESYALAAPLIQRAIAEEGMGDHAAALWHWDMAQTLFPGAANADLSSFGAPGEMLKRNLLPNPNPPSCTHQRSTDPSAKVVKTIEPEYPEGARLSRQSGIVIMNVTVAADGSISEPRVVKPLSAPLTFAALEGTRLWTFAPAMVDGKPVASNYCLTVNFRLR